MVGAPTAENDIVHLATPLLLTGAPQVDAPAGAENTTPPDVIGFPVAVSVTVARSCTGANPKDAEIVAGLGVAVMVVVVGTGTIGGMTVVVVEPLEACRPDPDAGTKVAVTGNVPVAV
jgi:hypothetical protein